MKRERIRKKWLPIDGQKDGQPIRTGALFQFQLLIDPSQAFPLCFTPFTSSNTSNELPWSHSLTFSWEQSVSHKTISDTGTDALMSQMWTMIIQALPDEN